MAAVAGFSPVSSAPGGVVPARANTGTDKDKVQGVARDFETVFLTNMFENMFEGLDDDGPFGSGAGNGAWRSMLTEQYAKSVAATGGIGIADQVQRQLVALQEIHK